jgi:hypothetical protein
MEHRFRILVGLSARTEHNINDGISLDKSVPQAFG